MRRSTYFLVVGIIELVAFAVGVIVFLIQLISAIRYGVDIALNIFLFAAYLLVGPAIGILFIDHARFLEKEEMLDKQLNVGSNSNEEDYVPLRFGESVQVGSCVYNRFDYFDEKTETTIKAKSQGVVRFVDNYVLIVCFTINTKSIEIAKPFNSFCRKVEK